MSDQARWLEIRRGAAPLLLSLPHTGTELPEALEARLVSPWLARKDADWHIERLYEFAAALGATLVRTRISRTVIDVNRDPSGQSLYPGQFTTGLCPVETFDGEQLYRSDPPDDTEIAARRQDYFDPYHAALGAELQRLRQSHDRVVLYDCHSIRSIVPALFEGALPNVNIGTNSGASCDPAVTACLEHAFADGHFFDGAQRPLQGRLDHAPLRATRARHPRDPDRARLPRLHPGTGRGPELGKLATRL